MIVVMGQRRVNLRQRQVRMLQGHLLRAGAVRQPVLDHLDDFHVRVVNPRPPLRVRVDVGNGFGGNHGGTVCVPATARKWENKPESNTNPFA